MKRLLIALAVIALASPLAHSDIEATRTTLKQHILRLINRDRQLYNLPPVQLDLQGSVYADNYCERQLVNKTNGHFTTDGLPPYMRYSFAGGNDGVSENAAAWSANYSFNDRALYEMARRSQDAMMAEMPPHDGHKRTILDPHATHVGIGVAWRDGEFRLVHEFVRRYVKWSKPLPRQAHVADTIIATGSPLPGVQVEAISVHHEKTPEAMPAHVANALESYSLPDKRRDYLPRLKQEYRLGHNRSLEIVKREYADGSRGDFYLADDGSFSFEVPFSEGPGVYTVVVWVRKKGAPTTIAASNVSIRVEGSTAPRALRAGALSR
ncbi:MAG TPA: CAP domain-containing protein [Thermoanaerobaculia bacterium]|nr:CAP domain-containing protein [Thermoanaerobaculia bacterium]